MELFSLNTVILICATAGHSKLRAVDIASKNSWPVFGREMVSVGEGGSELVKLRHQEKVSQGLELWISQAVCWGKY